MSVLARPLKLPPTFPLQKGLVLWLPIDERSGAKTYDRSEKANHGTISDGTWIAGYRGSALSFDGINDYVNIPHHTSLMPSVISVIARVKLPASQLNPDPPFASKWGAGLDRSYSLGYDTATTNKVAFFELTSADDQFGIIYGTTLINDNKWHIVVGTYDGETLRLYIDGILDTVSVYVGITGSLKVSTCAVQVGRAVRTPSRLLLGIVNDVRIYNRALNAAEIKRLSESELMLTRW